MHVPVIDHCRSDPCVHGTCRNHLSGYSCVCYDGYAGQNCAEGKPFYSNILMTALDKM